MRQFNKESGVDVDSPSVMVIFSFFFAKAKEAFQDAGMDENISDLFFRSFVKVTDNWKADLRKEFERIRDAKNPAKQQ